MTASDWFIVVGGDVVLVLAIGAAWLVRRSVDRPQASQIKPV